METKRNLRIRNAIHLILGVGVATLVATTVHAEEEAAAELERVQVTGTRLTQLQIEGAAPVTVISREDLARVPYDSVGQLLQALPSTSGSPINTYTNNGGSGSVLVNLRGLGSARTLVLINGRRADAAGDLNTIPIAMVERLEVLKDGASAIYGADAVAGVINIITRSDYEGMEVSAQQSNWSQTNAPTIRVSGITGGNSDRGNFVVGFDFVDQDGAFQDEVDTPWMQRPLTVVDAESFRRFGLVESGPNQNVIELGSSSTPEGQFRLEDGRVLTLDYVRNADGSRTYSYDPATHTGTYRDYIGSGDPNDSYNYNPDNYIQTPSKRISFFLQGNYSVHDDLTFFTEAQFQRRESELFLAPLPYFSDNGDPGYVYTVMVDTDGDGVGDAPETRRGVSANNFYNPFGENLEVRRRVVELGGRTSTATQDAYRLVLGLNGVLADRWNYEISYNYSETLFANLDNGQFYGANLELALGDSFMDADGNIVCGTPGNVIEGCVPLNLFGGPGTITQEMIDYVSVSLNDRTDSRTDVLHASISGDLFEMPAGPMQGAFGIERRREKLSDIPDSSKAFNAVTGNAFGPTFGAKEVDSMFVEFGVPILSDVFAARSLEAGLGFRRDDFNTFGSASSGQVQLRWQPVEDVLVRATVGESFREPSIFDLFSAQGDSFPQATDPCGRASIGTLEPDQIARCVAAGVPFSDDGDPSNDGWNDTGVSQLLTKVGGNPNVGPEEGESFTIGIGWAPEMVPGFSMVVDYWDFTVDGAIGSVGPDSVLSGCVRDGTASFCDDIVRNASGRPVEILTLVDNLGALTAKGIDFEFNYANATGFGDFNHRLLITHLMERTQQEFPGAPIESLEGLFDTTVIEDVGFPEIRLMYSLDWMFSQWGASASIEHVDSMTDDNNHPFGLWEQGDEPLPVPSVTYLDLTGHYYFRSGATIDFGITNVTDEEAPFINSAFNANIDESMHRPMGMGYFFRLTQSFD